MSTKPNGPASGTMQPLLILGASGTLGRAFGRVCDVRGIPHRALTHHDLDIADANAVSAALAAVCPWAVVNAAGFVRVDAAERQRDACFRANSTGAAVLASVCEDLELQLLTFSSDLVFDGAQREPYIESDPVCPLGVYGRSKADAESRVLAMMPSALVVRTSSFFGPWDEANVITLALRELAAGRTFPAANDTVISPTYVVHLVNACLDLLIGRERGVWHLVNDGALTWADFVRLAAETCSVTTGRVDDRSAAEMGWLAPRPAFSVLGSHRGWTMPTVLDALVCYREDRRA